MPKLYPEDQARVDQVLSQGIYKVERKPFKFWGLLGLLLSFLVVISVIGYGLARYYDHL